MSRRMWTGILAGVLAAAVVLGVAGIAYNAGQRSEVVTRTVGDEGVRVVGGYGWGYGHGYGHGGFFLFPLLLTALLVFLLVRAFRWGGYGGRWGGYGGSGRAGCGPDGDARFEEQHRRAHAGPAPEEPGEA